jgi:hypothetical protein
MKPVAWRAPILAQFSLAIAAVARLSVVADPDELLAEPGIVEGIRARGFEILPFADHVAFRYAYERRFRELWDAGQTTTLVVVPRTASAEVAGLPFDLLDQARRDSRILRGVFVQPLRRFPEKILPNWGRVDKALRAASTSGLTGGCASLIHPTTLPLSRYDYFNVSSG